MLEIKRIYDDDKSTIGLPFFGDLFDERVFGFWSGELRTIGNLLKRFMMTLVCLISGGGCIRGLLMMSMRDWVAL